MKLNQLFERSSPHDENIDLDKAPSPKAPTDDFITTAQAAKLLGVTMSRVRQFIMEKRLKTYPPEKGRRDHLLKRSEVESFKDKDREITGRPPEDKPKKDKD